jgi:hypothetical protein
MKGPSRNTARAHRPGPSGEPIRADELLPWSALHARLGWGSRTIAKARAEGLRVLAFGGRLYVKGADIIAFLDAKNARPGHGQQPAGQDPNGDSEDDSTPHDHH